MIIRFVVKIFMGPGSITTIVVPCVALLCIQLFIWQNSVSLNKSCGY
jgi:hypothetical protein